jgi:hypothetical protein
MVSPIKVAKEQCGTGIQLINLVCKMKTKRLLLTSWIELNSNHWNLTVSWFIYKNRIFRNDIKFLKFIQKLIIEPKSFFFINNAITSNVAGFSGSFIVLSKSKIVCFSSSSVL